MAVPSKKGSGVTATPKADRERDLKDYPFLVRVLITFTKLNEQSNETKFKEEVVFKLDRPSAEMPWYVLRNYLVPKYLVQKYGPAEVGWQRIYEIKIQKLINRLNPESIEGIPMRVMTIEQLEAYCKRWDLHVPVHEFFSVEKAREFVALRQEDEKGYQKHLEEYRAGKQRQYPELDGMRGDKEIEIGDMKEFDELDKQTPLVQDPAKPKAEVVEPSDVEKNLLGMTGAAEEKTAVSENPFAGV